MNEEILIQEISQLRELLRVKEAHLNSLRECKKISQKYGLNNDEISRYSRQIFLPNFGVQGQLRLKNSSVLIVGAGGLGCPAGLYLASAGIGHIGIVDYDNIEISNLHRQILFSEFNVGHEKVSAAAESLKKINSNVKITPYKIQLDSSNALPIIKEYDIILDATDNVATRYLLNDACVLSKKPLVSGSALRFEGHLTVFNYNGPCYRCIFPKPPPPEAVTNCGDGGVLGAVVGTIGVLQALETIKILLNMSSVLSGRLLIFDGIDMKFQNVKLRSKDENCDVCGKKPIIHSLIDYEQFCGAKANDKDPSLNLLKEEERLTVMAYSDERKNNSKSSLLIDVRSNEEYEICQLDDSINIPINEIYNNNSTDLIQNKIKEIQLEENNVDVYVICRRGNDSQKAVKHLKETINNEKIRIRDIIGGIHAWSRNIDSTFPIY